LVKRRKRWLIWIQKTKPSRLDVTVYPDEREKRGRKGCSELIRGGRRNAVLKGTGRIYYACPWLEKQGQSELGGEAKAGEKGMKAVMI